MRLSELALLVGQLGRHHVVLELEEAVARKPVGIEPDAIAPRGRAKLPEDRRLASALRVALQVVLEEARGEPGAKIVILGVEQGRDFIPPRISVGAEDHVEHRSHRGVRSRG